jgi:hypothetical protein
VRRLVAAIAAVGALAACSGEAPRVEQSAPPTSYRITYEVTTGDTTTTEIHTVRRPFMGRVDIGDTSRVTDVGLLATSSPDTPWVRIQVPIAPAGGDVRPDAVLDDAIAAELVEEAGTRRIAGRSCRVVRLGGPMSGGTLTPVGAVAGESAEACVDGTGLVLAETWLVDGDVQREMEATSVEVGDVDDDVFAVPSGATDLTFRQGGGSVEAVARDEDPGFSERWRADVPDGFEHAGRYLVLPPQLGEPVDPSVPRSADVALLTDVWVRGADVLIIDQGAARGGGAPPWDERPYSKDVALGALGDGTVVFDLRLSEVRVARPDGGFVRVAGTLPPDRLVELARSLELEEDA